MAHPLRLLSVGPSPVFRSDPDGPWGPLEVEAVQTLDDAAMRLGQQGFDAVLLDLSGEEAQQVAHWPALSHAVRDASVVVRTARPTAALGAALLERGVQDLIGERDDAARALHLAVARRQREGALRSAYATDLATGLPNHSQLLEHMNHLLALREREPAPMALLVVRIEGLATAEATLGHAEAGALRRKLAVRLRAALRASDVVASVGSDAFAALLAWIDEPSAGERVAAKLVPALTRAIRVGGRETALSISIGIGQYPAHGKDAQSLLRQAFAQSAGQVPIGRAGFANFVERGAAVAANDELPGD